jgi:hypothetical protein
MLTASALLWTRIAAGVCLLIVVNLVYSLWKMQNQVAAGKVWSKTSGRIAASSTSRPDVDSSADSTDSTVEIRYQYRVGEKDFESKRIKFGGHAGMTQIDAAALVARYPAGATVDVYYDPKVPFHAVLEPGNKTNRTPLIVFLILFSMATAILLAHSIAGRVLKTAGGFPMFGLALPLLAVIIGIAAFVQYFMLRQQESASLRWPSVQGRITAANIAVEERDEEDDGSNRIRTVRLYRPDVQFAYSVGGSELHGNSRTWGWAALYPDEDSARKEIAKYTTGASVPVFYDPSRPGNAILEPRNRSGNAAQLIFGAMFFLGGALMFWAFATTPGWQ